MTLIEAARTMLANSFLPNTFWAEAVSTACYVLNRVLVTKPQNKTPYELITSKIPIISYIRPFGCHVTILNTIDHLGKFDGKSDEGFLVGYSLQSKAFRVYNLETKRVEENLHITILENKPNVAGKGPTWLFDLDYLTDSMNYQPVRSENQANKHAGPQEANQNAGTEDIIDAGVSEKEAESAQDYFVLPIWSSYSSTVKRSTAKDEGEAPNKNPNLKTDEKPVDKEYQVFLDELERLKRQEHDANDAVEALRKEVAQKTKDLLLQAGAAKASSNNIVNTASTPVSTASPYGGLSFTDLTNPDQDDSEIPALEEIYANPTDGIFTNSSYDDEGAVVDFTNLEPVVNVSPIPTLRINSTHPSTLILRDPQSAKISEALKDKSWVDAMQEELLQFKIQKVWILVDLRYGKKEIGTKWVYRNKKDERGVVVRNKASAFLYGKIDEEVYVSQPLGFIDPKYPMKKSLMKFDFASVKTSSTPIETKAVGKDEKVLMWSFRRLISWQCKKQTIMATSTTEAEYVAAAKLLWASFVDSKSNNPVFHSKTKHIEIRHHFIRDAYEKKLIQKDDGMLSSYEFMDFLYTEAQFNYALTLKNVPIPLDHFPINTLTSKVLSFMVKKGKNFSGNVTPLFDSMLVQPTEDEGKALERPSESQPIPSPSYQVKINLSQTDPIPRPSPSIPSNFFDVAFNDLDAMDYMETEDAHNEKGVSTEDQVTTVNPDEGSDKLDEGTTEPKNGNSDENATPTATLTVFGDDETIAEFLVSMSQNKAKQKRVEIKDAKDSDRPRPTSTRSTLTLKPLHKIDPKDKGKKVLEEEAESEAESKGVNEAKRKFARLANDEEIARKVQEEWEERERKKIEADSILDVRLQEEEREKFTIEEEPTPDEDKEVDYEILDKKYPIIEWKSKHLGIKPQYDEAKDLEEINLNVMICVVYQLVMDRYKDEIPEGFDRVLWGDLMIMFNPSDEDEFWNSQQDWNVVSWKLHGSSGVHTLMTDEGLVIHML
ncbi:ribonuclease H-like domain-containing protein [Tanacetum coccineum]